jgi:tRNA threonylcarbamoyladenosine biosynthesis protein TsaB
VRPERFLAIETSSPRLSLAIGDEAKVLSTYTGTHDWRHAESLFKGIESLLKRRKWKIQSITGVGVSIGPGSFTGIRIGIALARAMGQSLRIPVVGISALAAMAAGARTRSKWLSPRINALRGNVFTGLYQRNGSGTLHRIIAETMVSAPEWPRRLKPYIGSESLWISPLQGCYPEAKELLNLARPKLAKAGPESYQAVLPLYIRRSSAEERRT